MDENTIKQEVTEMLRREFSEPTYTDSERLAAYEILLAEIQKILRYTDYEYISDMIDEELDK